MIQRPLTSAKCQVAVFAMGNCLSIEESERLESLDLAIMSALDSIQSLRGRIGTLASGYNRLYQSLLDAYPDMTHLKSRAKLDYSGVATVYRLDANRFRVKIECMGDEQVSVEFECDTTCW